MNNDREKLIQEVCQKVNDILDRSRYCYTTNKDNENRLCYASVTEEYLIFHLRVLHFLANPNDNEDKVSAIYKKLQNNLEETFSLISKGTLHSVSLNQIHWENLLSQLVIRTYPSFVRK